MFFLNFISYLLFFLPFILGQINCNNPDTNNAKCVCDGIEYDFNLIQPSDGNSYFFGADVNNTYMYYFQMSNGGLPNTQGAMPYCSFSGGNDQGIAISKGEIYGNSCIPIGLVSEQSWVLYDKNDEQYIQITFNGGNDGRKGILNVKCNSDYNDPKFIVKGEIDTLIYELDIITKYACNPNTKSKYKCINNKCVKVKKGGVSLDTCKKMCNNVTYSCINNKCIAINGNSSITKKQCRQNCGKNILYERFNKLKTYFMN